MSTTSYRQEDTTIFGQLLRYPNMLFIAKQDFKPIIVHLFT